MNKVKKSILLSAACIAFAHGQALKVGWCTGYYTSWAQNGSANYTIGGKPYTPEQIPWKAYTHMVHFSVTPNNDGSINLGGMGLNASMINAFVTAAHTNKVKAIICIGGGGTGGAYAAAASSAGNRTKFVQNILNFMQQYRYDGADIDWEDNINQANYVALFQELRAQFDKQPVKPLLTVAVASYFADQSASSGQYVDQMNNMSYWTKLADMDGVMNAFNSKGVPKSKQGIGIGLDINEKPTEVDCDPISAKGKALYAINNGYGGIMIWELEMDAKKYNGQTPIHDTIAHYVDKSATVSARLGQPQSALRLAFDGSYKLSYELPAAGGVDLALYDAAGNRVRGLFSGAQARGAHSLDLQGNGKVTSGMLASGAYWVRLETPQGAVSTPAPFAR